MRENYEKINKNEKGLFLEKLIYFIFDVSLVVAIFFKKINQIKKTQIQ